MNKSAAPHDTHEWITPQIAGTNPVVGYDAWLAQDIAAGLADLDVGKATPLADIRKEFGIE